MKVDNLHGWHLSTVQARELQERLASKVSRKNSSTKLRCVAGADISVSRELGVATGTVVVLDYPGLNVVETRTVRGRLEFPYVPGLLSFREMPLTLAAFEKLETIPDLVLVDGQGIAHPRRLGLASHLGLFLDIPTIGCAKSLLCGTHDEPPPEPGDSVPIRDGDEIIGAVLRTRRNVKPVYVSVGHRIDLETAVRRVLDCCRGYRLPEPTRLAHHAAKGALKGGAATGPENRML